MTGGTTAADRVETFLGRRSEMSGIDQQVVVSLDGDQHVLSVRDLRVLVRKARTLEAALPLIDDLAETVRLEGRTR